MLLIKLGIHLQSHTWPSGASVELRGSYDTHV